MRLDKKTGNMIVACPNFNDKKFPGVLIQITPDNKAEMYFDKCPKHPDTGYAFPMGMDFGPGHHNPAAESARASPRSSRPPVRLRARSG